MLRELTIPTVFVAEGARACVCFVFLEGTRLLHLQCTGCFRPFSPHRLAIDGCRAAELILQPFPASSTVDGI